MIQAEAAGKAGDELQAVDDNWTRKANLKVFDEAVVDAIKAGSASNKTDLINKYKAAAKGKSNTEARKIAKQLTGQDIYFNWDSARTREGYYRYQGGTQCAINRANCYAPYADAIWMESKLPDYKQAKEFADGVHAVWPEQK